MSESGPIHEFEELLARYNRAFYDRDLAALRRNPAMPTISMFYGIIVRMYFVPSEHPPLHFHVYYAEYRARVDRRGLIFALARSLTANFQESRPGWFWRERNFTRKISWLTGNLS